MKKLLFLLVFVLILPLCACTVKEGPAPECVSDELSVPSVPEFYLSADIPQGTFLTASCKEGCCALFSHADYEVMQEIFTAASLDEALVYLTGKNRAELKPLEVSTFPQKEYRFAWTAAGEAGTLACSGLLFSDGENYYSLCIFCDAAEEKHHKTEFSHIFSGSQLIPV